MLLLLSVSPKTLFFSYFGLPVQILVDSKEPFFHIDFHKKITEGSIV
jgi:hypothetical protein